MAALGVVDRADTPRDLIELWQQSPRRRRPEQSLRDRNSGGTVGLKVEATRNAVIGLR
jgi:hypothetical protein